MASGREGRGESEMGTVISFRPVLRTGRGSKSIACKSESATVIILPVIRIERYTDEPTRGIEPSGSPRGRRRRRANRS
jgi:hypothetical protein